MNKKKFVTFVFILLIILFALFIIFSFFPQKNVFANIFSRLSGAQPQGTGGAQRGVGENRGGSGAPAQQQGAGGAQRSAAGRDGTRNAAAIRTVTVAPGTIEKSVIINGEILARNQVTIYPTVGGRLVECNYSVGDRVVRGAVVARVDPSRPGEVYSRSSVISTVSGTVLQAPYSVGDTVTTQSPVYVVGDLSSLLVETNIAERFVSAVKQGLRASLWFESMPGEIFTAEIYEINPVLDPASRTLRTRLRFIKPDPRIKAGMFATISLVTNRKTNIPVIPRLSVINTYGSWIVFIVDENNTARRREVTLGIDNEEFIEVLDGVSIGDKVVSAGQNFLSDGDFVRIVE
ncbi:MAG: efflux RND transporter periplasmic adaptor subunit [Spirochaetes bacterium]|nr:efflux RND transporter periplasmic adaptor subunit [Spirochaetota bacterium]